MNFLITADHSVNLYFKRKLKVHNDFMENINGPDPVLGDLFMDGVLIGTVTSHRKMLFAFFIQT